jgi:hypothetical protein
MHCQEDITSMQYRDCAIGHMQKKLSKNYNASKPSQSCTTLNLMFVHYNIYNAVCNGTENDEIESLNAIVYKGRAECVQRCDVNFYRTQKTYIHTNKRYSRYSARFFSVEITMDSIFRNGKESFVVVEKVEKNVYDMFSALAAFGGSLGLFLGCSCYSVFKIILKWFKANCRKKHSDQDSRNPCPVLPSPVTESIPTDFNPVRPVLPKCIPV